MEFKEFMDIDSIENLTESTNLKDLDEYDSFFVLSVIAFLDEQLGVKITLDQFEKMNSLGDLISFIGNEKII